MELQEQLHAMGFFCKITLDVDGNCRLLLSPNVQHMKNACIAGDGEIRNRSGNRMSLNVEQLVRNSE